jgi:hypothetical protein
MLLLLVLVAVLCKKEQQRAIVCSCAAVCTFIRSLQQ